MSHNLLRDARLHELLAGIDHDVAAQAKAEGCPCGGRLHEAAFPRKPRGVPRAFEELYRKRFSLCCGSEGCRQRVTPPSVRFLRGRLYVSVVVVLVTVMASGPTPKRIACLRELLGEDLSERTLGRWREWWQSSLPRTDFWREHGACLMPPVVVARLPTSLLERFEADDDRGKLVAMLRFLAPVTTGSCSAGASNARASGGTQSSRVEGSASDD